MADKHSYTVSINGDDYTVESDTPLSDSQAYEYAKTQAPAAPKPTIAEQNAIARANMAKQHEGEHAPSFTHEFIRGVEEGTTPPDAGMGRNLLGTIARVGPGRAMRGSEQLAAGTVKAATGEGGAATDLKQGAHNLIAGGGTTTALMFAPELVANPVMTGTALALGAGGDVVGRKAAEALGGDEDTQNLAGDVAGIASVYGGAKLGGTIPSGPVLRFVGGEMARPGGVQGVVGRTISAAANAGDELGARARGPIQDLMRPSAESVARTRSAAMTDAAKIEADTKAAQHDDAIATNRHIDKSARIALKKAAAKPAAPDAVRDLVTPVADASASNPDVAARERPLPVVGAREPGRVTAIDQQLGLDPALFRAGNTDVAAPAPGARIASLITGEPIRTVDQPLFRQQDAMDLGEAVNGPNAEPPSSGRVPTPTHLQGGIGGRGTESAPFKAAAVKAPVAKATLNDLVDSMQVVGDDGGPNASGESAASREALSRQAGMKARGEQFAVRKGGTTRPLAGPDAVDYNPQPGEQFGVLDKDGHFRVLSLGEAREQLIGARGKGHMTKANREALFNALLKRVSK